MMPFKEGIHRSDIKADWLGQVERRENVPHRILLICFERSATQEIHFLRPLRKAQEEGECELLLISERVLESFTLRERHRWIRDLWQSFRPTVAIFSRYAGPDHSLLVELAKTHQTPIVAHLDDDLFDVPAVLGEGKRRFHSKPERLLSLDHVFRSADLIYVPTEPLAERMRQRRFPAPVVVPPIQVGADPEELRPPRSSLGAQIVIGYMGTVSHTHDLELVVPGLVRLLDRYDNVRFETFGSIGMPPRLVPFGTRVRAIPSESGYAPFLEKLSALRWDLGLAPLRKVPFNECRTYTKWLEYTVAGIAVLASDNVVYRGVIGGGGGLLVEDEEWPDCLRFAVDSLQECRKYTRRAQHTVRLSLSLERLAGSLLSLQSSIGTLAHTDESE